MPKITSVLSLLVFLVTFQVHAGETIPGPIPATVVEITDGDTITVEARIWLGQSITTKVRLNGADTPEIRGKCEEERQLAIKAKEFVAEVLKGNQVTLLQVHYGKYAGRVVADVVVGGKVLSEMLIEKGLGKSYDGGKRVGWCE